MPKFFDIAALRDQDPAAKAREEHQQELIAAEDNAGIRSGEDLIRLIAQILADPIDYCLQKTREKPKRAEVYALMGLVEASGDDELEEWLGLDADKRVNHQLALKAFTFKPGSYTMHSYMRVFDVAVAMIHTALEDLHKNGGGDWRPAGFSYDYETRIRRVPTGEPSGNLGLAMVAAVSPNFNSHRQDIQTIRRPEQPYEVLVVQIAFLEVTGARPSDYMSQTHNRTDGKGYAFAVSEGMLSKMPPDWRQQRNKASEIIRSTQAALRGAPNPPTAPKSSKRIAASP